MWADILDAGVSLPEKTIRTVLVYLAVVVLLRVVGRRVVGQLNAMDLVVMLLLSNVVQNAIIGPDNSVWGAVYGAMVLLAVNSLAVHAAARWGRVEWLLEGATKVLASNGSYEMTAIRRMGLRRADLAAAIRAQGADRIQDAELVTLEPRGTVLVRLIRAEENASEGDIERLNARLERIENHLAALAARPGPTPPATGLS